MITGALSNPGRIEVSTLQQYIGGVLISTATLTAKHTGNTHRLLGIADSQITVGQLMSLTVEGYERSSLWHGLHNNLVTLDHIHIEAVQRLSVSKHHIVGDVHNIINRTQTDNLQLVLQPFRTLLNGTVLHGNSTVSRTSFGILYTNFHIQIVVIHSKSLCVRTMDRSLVTVLYQPGIQVAGYTIV